MARRCRYEWELWRHGLNWAACFRCKADSKKDFLDELPLSRDASRCSRCRPRMRTCDSWPALTRLGESVRDWRALWGEERRGVCSHLAVCEVFIYNFSDEAQRAAGRADEESKQGIWCSIFFSLLLRQLCIFRFKYAPPSRALSAEAELAVFALAA